MVSAAPIKVEAAPAHGAFVRGEKNVNRPGALVTAVPGPRGGQPQVTPGAEPGPGPAGPGGTAELLRGKIWGLWRFTAVL